MIDLDLIAPAKPAFNELTIHFPAKLPPDFFPAWTK
jgi:hypothetical protein